MAEPSKNQSSQQRLRYGPDAEIVQIARAFVSCKADARTGISGAPAVYKIIGCHAVQGNLHACRCGMEAHVIAVGLLVEK